MPRVRPFFDDDRGATAVEAALVLPLYIAIIFMVIELGAILWTYNCIQYVADTLSRCYVTGYCTDSNKGTVAYNSPGNIWSSSSAAANDITVLVTTCGTSPQFGVRVTVTRQMTATPLSAFQGYFQPTPFAWVTWPFSQVTAQSCYPKPS